MYPNEIHIDFLKWLYRNVTVCFKNSVYVFITDERKSAYEALSFKSLKIKQFYKMGDIFITCIVSRFMYMFNGKFELSNHKAPIPLIQKSVYILHKWLRTILYTLN